MKVLSEMVFTGTWRSYKVFHPSGNVKFYSINSFLEFDFKENKVLTITQHIDHTEKKLIKTDKWTIELNNKKHYLHIDGFRITYEVITINHTVLVLMDSTTHEKIFFVKKEHWEAHIKSNTTLVL